MTNILYSNEIVFRGHPDKVCDQISDALLDELLRVDPNSRSGIEVAGGKGLIFITGEIKTNAQLDVEKIAKNVLSKVGYNADEYKIINNIGTQSADIALGTNDAVGGAGDQGMMFGYACDSTEELLPTAMVILQRLSRVYDELRKVDGRFLPDGKAQITGVYSGDTQIGARKLEKIKTFTISYQNTEVEREKTDAIIRDVCLKICEEYGVEVESFLINPTGKFLIGGFEGDAGLTGRKIVVDSYQSFANVGGGAFSGKDPTKVDRSGAYKARQLACRYLQKYELKWCEVQLSYAIGKDEPLAIYINSDRGSLPVSDAVYKECTPKNIINDLKLRQPIYENKSKFGHFQSPNFDW